MLGLVFRQLAPRQVGRTVGGDCGVLVDAAGITLTICADWTEPARDKTYTDWLGGLARDPRPYSELVDLN
jgi:hypothetical protein